LISRIIDISAITALSWRQKLNSLSGRTLTLIKLGDNSVPMSGLQNPKIARLRHRTKKGGGGKPAIFNLWSAGWAGTAFGLRAYE
jgi:hypothetical protein